MEGLDDGLVRPSPEGPRRDQGRPRQGAGEVEPRDQAANLTSGTLRGVVETLATASRVELPEM